MADVAPNVLQLHSCGPGDAGQLLHDVQELRLLVRDEVNQVVHEGQRAGAAAQPLGISVVPIPSVPRRWRQGCLNLLELRELRQGTHAEALCVAAGSAVVEQVARFEDQQEDGRQAPAAPHLRQGPRHGGQLLVQLRHAAIEAGPELVQQQAVVEVRHVVHRHKKLGCVVQHVQLAVGLDVGASGRHLLRRGQDGRLPRLGVASEDQVRRVGREHGLVERQDRVADLGHAEVPQRVQPDAYAHGPSGRRQRHLPGLFRVVVCPASRQLALRGTPGEESLYGRPRDLDVLAVLVLCPKGALRRRDLLPAQGLELGHRAPRLRLFCVLAGTFGLRAIPSRR
mmetsp:Transcript_99356/g.276622  ORF Transcript_99356/g.276622 Transcript_99356/m.276622 type:complete len:339 (-) Transcript_99356:108-1124(-)